MGTKAKVVRIHCVIEDGFGSALTSSAQEMKAEWLGQCPCEGIQKGRVTVTCLWINLVLGLASSRNRVAGRKIVLPILANMARLSVGAILLRGGTVE